jgi:hypothetical protein
MKEPVLKPQSVLVCIRDEDQRASESRQCDSPSECNKNRSQKWSTPILQAPEGRRDEFVDPYLKQAKGDEVVCIIKAREPSRILTAIGSRGATAGIWN